MTPGQLKGTLLEYIVRQLLQNCGFNSVKPDGHYIYQQNGTGLFYINGKGAAHDADVLMEPPIQLPFSYPSRLLFECKAYSNNVGLHVVRNALGLRYDINEFEIVTDNSIQQRKNNRRANYAISDRKRYNYQVGVASVEPFSASAFEFAANNKIPLLSMRWFLPSRVCDLFHSITLPYLNSIPIEIRNRLYAFLKDKRKDSTYNYEGMRDFIQRDSIIGEIIRNFESVLDRSFIGLIETGDLIFLFAENDNNNILSQQAIFEGVRAQIHYSRQQPNVWILDLIDGNRNSEFKFFVPDRIMKMWKEFSLDKTVAINLKEQFFSRIFIFTRQQDNRRLPFIAVNIDQEWLDNIREQ